MTERNQLRLKTEEEMTEEKLVDGAKAAQAIFSPAPAPFNFDRWKTETLNGLRSMEAERETLRQEAQRIAERIVFLDHDIDALRAVAESFTDPDDAKRDSMVKTTLEGLALGIVEWTNLEGVSSILREAKPGVKESSVRSAISRLVRDGVLLQDPPVGEVPKGSRVERRWKVSPSYVTYQEQAREEAASQEGASDAPSNDRIVARIHRLLKSKPDGITGKDLAWLAADLNVEIGPIEAAIKSMGDAVEMVKENGENILRTKAEPGSREELKRTKITDNPLFPNMDRPDHA